MQLFKKRVSIERLFAKAKEWLLLDHMRVRGIEQSFIHTSLAFIAMTTIALAAIKEHEPRFIRSIKQCTTA